MKKYYKKIDLVSLNARKEFVGKMDLPLFKPSKYIVNTFFVSGVSFVFYYFGHSYIKYLQQVYLKEKQKAHKGLIKHDFSKAKEEKITDTLDMVKYFNIEDSLGILDWRKDLIEEVRGNVLEVNCSSFINSQLYTELIERILLSEDPSLALKYQLRSITAVDDNETYLEIASSNNKSKFISFHLMKPTDLRFNDNTFDTVVDCFGLNTSNNIQQQISEMKRVLKPGGKMLLLLFGESVWLTTNLKQMRKFYDGELNYLPFINWNELLTYQFGSGLKSELDIVKSKRKLNGKLYYLELIKK